MKTMILAIRNRSRKGLITPTKEVFMAIGNLTFDQLCNLRHRGAFSTVSSTFTTCCQQSKHLDLSTDDQSVLTTWYNVSCILRHRLARKHMLIIFREPWMPLIPKCQLHDDQPVFLH